MAYTFAFRNKQTGEVNRTKARSLWSAAHALGIGLAAPGQATEPWMLWECWEGQECLWHYTEAGEIKTGRRTN